MRPDQHVVADVDRVPRRAPDVEVLSKHTLRADAYRRPMGLDHGAVRDVRSRADRHVTAYDCCRCNVRGRIDAGSFALVFDQHTDPFDRMAVSSLTIRLRRDLTSEHIGECDAWVVRTRYLGWSTA